MPVVDIYVHTASHIPSGCVFGQFYPAYSYSQKHSVGVFVYLVRHIEIIDFLFFAVKPYIYAQDVFGIR